MYEMYFSNYLSLTLKLLSYRLSSFYSVAIFFKLGVDGFLGSIVLFSLMLVAQIGGIFLIDKVSIIIANWYNFWAADLAMNLHSLQCGRKFLLLLGAVILSLLLISAAALIQIFNLDDATSVGVGKRVAGYLVVALICLMMCISNISYR